MVHILRCGSITITSSCGYRSNTCSIITFIENDFPAPDVASTQPFPFSNFFLSQNTGFLDTGKIKKNIKFRLGHTLIYRLKMQDSSVMNFKWQERKAKVFQPDPKKFRKFFRKSLVSGLKLV